ncbi:MAG TPA: TolC family protein [Lutibacter sp.]|nr:TolC family protein [Lutibacter sp.]
MKIKFLLLMLFPTLIWSQEPTSFSLQEAVDYAKLHAYAIQNADDDIEIASRKVWETTTMGLPQINAKVDYQNFLKQPISLIPAEFFGGQPGEFAEISFGTKQNINASATLTQLLFNGSYLVGLQSAIVYKEISESIKTKTIAGVKESVTNAYAGVLMTDEGIKILNKNKVILEKNLSDTRLIYKNGFAEEQDVEQLQLTLSKINKELSNIKRLRIYNLNMLKYAMGITIDTPINLSQTLEDLALVNSDLNLTNEVFDYQLHIDYKISENSIKANQLFVKLEKSKALPSLNAFLNYGLTANNEEFKFFKSEQKWFDSSVFGVQLNVPIFSSFKRHSRIQQAKIGLTKSERALDETTQKLKLKHQTALLSYQNALESYQTAKESVVLAERIEKKENIKFFEGVSTNFSLSIAQNQLYAQQQEYLQSIFNLISKKVALETALDK